jgi:hypothetical protein
MAKGTMELLNPYSGQMRCRICGSEHWASIKPNSNGRYYRGSWQCIRRGQHQGTGTHRPIAVGSYVSVTEVSGMEAPDRLLNRAAKDGEAGTTKQC